MKYRTCQNWLAGTWVIFFLLQLALLIYRSIASSNGTEDIKFTSDLWSWYMPMVMPTLSLIIAALFTATPENVPKTSVFRLAILVLLSVAYLVAISALIVLPPSFDTPPKEHLALLRSSNYALGVFQLCIGAGLGTFFPKKASEEKPEKGATDAVAKPAN